MEPTINFDDIDQNGPRTIQGTLTLSAEEIGEDVETIGTIDYDLKVRALEGNPGYVVDGSLGYEAELRCARCAVPYPFANTSSFTVRYDPLPSSEAEQEELELSGESLDIEYFTERRIPISLVAIEQIELTLPMKPLCSETCQGLCPRCGADLNSGPCSCQDEMIDDRLTPLLELRAQLARKKEV